MSGNQRLFSIIPARGGSKRLKRKNSLMLHGKPLIAWSILASIDSGIFTNTYVSTDDPEIAGIARELGAVVLDRPDSLADDFSRVDQVCLYHLRNNNHLRDHDYFFCLYPTAPLRNSSDLISMGRQLQITNASSCLPDGVFAVSAFGHYPFQALYCNNNGFIEPYWPEHILKKGSDFPNFFAGNGSTYAISVRKFMKYGNFDPSNYCITPYEMPQLRSIDIDTIDDFNLLQKLTKPGSTGLEFI